jgi:predicted amidohydrolase
MARAESTRLFFGFFSADDSRLFIVKSETHRLRPHSDDLQLLATALVCAAGALDNNRTTYRAGTVQYTPPCDIGPSSSPKQKKNCVHKVTLPRYAKFFQEAAAANVELLVFPEGTMGWGAAEPDGYPAKHWTRDAMLPFCEQFPSIGQRPTTPALAALSVMAANASITSVVNTCELVLCNSTEPNCPADGRFQYNADAVFDETGVLIAKFHKNHLWEGGKVFDEPKSTYPVSFTSSKIGDSIKFGLMICADLQFAEPFASLAASGACDIAFSTWWDPDRPLQVSVELHSSFARATGATILSANAGGGGGIFAGGGSILAQYFDEKKRQDTHRLVVADVPIDNPCRRRYQVALEDSAQMALEDSALTKLEGEREAPAWVLAATRATTAPAVRATTAPAVPTAGVACGLDPIGQSGSGGSSYTQNGTCVFLDDKLTTNNQTLEVEHNGTRCTLQYSNSMLRSGAEKPTKPVRLALMALTGDLDSSPYTPDVLWSELCAVLMCSEDSDGHSGDGLSAARIVCKGPALGKTRLDTLRLSAQYKKVPGPRRVFPLLGIGTGAAVDANVSDFGQAGATAWLEAGPNALVEPLFSAALWAVYS